MKHYLRKTYCICLFLFLIIVAKTNAATPYTKLAKVTEIKQNWYMNDQSNFVQGNDIITITLIGGRNDGQKYKLEVKNRNYYNLEDLVEVHMNDNGTTNNFKDDEILDIRKVGK